MMKKLKVLMSLSLVGVSLCANGNDFLYMQDAIKKLIQMEQDTSKNIKFLTESQHRISDEISTLKSLQANSVNAGQLQGVLQEVESLKGEIALVKNSKVAPIVSSPVVDSSSDILALQQKLTSLESSVAESKALSSSALTLAQSAKSVPSSTVTSLPKIVIQESIKNFVDAPTSSIDSLNSSTIVETQFEPVSVSNDAAQLISSVSNIDSSHTGSTGIVSTDNVSVWDVPNMDTGHVVGSFKKGDNVGIEGYVMTPKNIGWVKLHKNQGYVLYGLIIDQGEIK